EAHRRGVGVGDRVGIEIGQGRAGGIGAVGLPGAVEEVGQGDDGEAAVGDVAGEHPVEVGAVGVEVVHGQVPGARRERDGGGVGGDRDAQEVEGIGGDDD